MKSEVKSYFSMIRMAAIPLEIHWDVEEEVSKPIRMMSYDVWTSVDQVQKAMEHEVKGKLK
jgi:hypothetical protein